MPCTPNTNNIIAKMDTTIFWFTFAFLIRKLLFIGRCTYLNFNNDSHAFVGGVSNPDISATVRQAAVLKSAKFVSSTICGVLAQMRSAFKKKNSEKYNQLFLITPSVLTFDKIPEGFSFPKF